MKHLVGIVGGGVSGLTCGVVFAEHGFRTALFAREIGQQTTSGAAGALWFPYDVEPADKVIPWALETFRALIHLAHNSNNGVSMIELRQVSGTREIQVPDWAIPLGARRLSAAATARFRLADRSSAKRLDTTRQLQDFQSGFSLRVPLMDTTVYLKYLTNRFLKAGGEITENVRFEKLEDIDRKFVVVINCAGIGARELAHDTEVEPHRGQVAIVPKIKNLAYAVVCDDAPLMYAIPRGNDCVLGGTNDLSDDLAADSATTARIVAECSRVLKIEKPSVLAERVGLRPFRQSGVRVELAYLRDGRTVIHNYGHGGSGFTLSWGCASTVLKLAT
ncbi:MAG TPA: FAD-dependent oxidoreductase [Candidatus Udaeobacter sp.]